MHEYMLLKDIWKGYILQNLQETFIPELTNLLHCDMY